ncbi:MAG: HEAT repeat domain-containing protein [Victivallales bacterium]|nr:HEAT repeat domain-containing protein [Victivallales bacterium]
MKKTILFLALFWAFGLFGHESWTTLQENSDVVLRRKAFKKLLYSAETFEKAVAFGLKDRDAQIRRIAIYELFMHDRKRALPVMHKMVADDSPEVCIMVVELARALEDKGEREAIAEKVLAASKVSEVRKAASRALGFDFFREVTLYSSNPANDHEVVTLKAIELPKNGWLFKTDESEMGHRGEKPFFLETLDDSEWRPISIGLSWERQGIPYDGIAWYRLKLKLPEKPEGAQASELHFLGVDEAAWVWVNGTFVGQHNLGTRGWNIPFKVDCTKELRWGAENSIVVRVEDAEQAGGIYKGIILEVLK